MTAVNRRVKGSCAEVGEGRGGGYTRSRGEGSIDRKPGPWGDGQGQRLGFQQGSLDTHTVKHEIFVA